MSGPPGPDRCQVFPLRQHRSLWSRRSARLHCPLLSFDIHVVPLAGANESEARNTAPNGRVGRCGYERTKTQVILRLSYDNCWHVTSSLQHIVALSRIPHFMTGCHRPSFAFNPEVLAIAFEGISSSRDYVVASRPADISRHHIAGVPRSRSKATAPDAISDLTGFQVDLPVVRAPVQQDKTQCKPE
jgi:hypothetical protein